MTGEIGELEGVEGEETVIRMYCMGEESNFSINKGEKVAKKQPQDKTNKQPPQKKSIKMIQRLWMEEVNYRPATDGGKV